MKPKIITMCGSTRFADLMAAISWEMEKLGYIVLRVNYVPGWYVKAAGWEKSDHGAEQDGLKEELDALHCRKIDMSDIVYVCNPEGYIGESTQIELEYAIEKDKAVLYLQDDGANIFTDMAYEMHQWWYDQLPENVGKTAGKAVEELVEALKGSKSFKIIEAEKRAKEMTAHEHRHCYGMDEDWYCFAANPAHLKSVKPEDMAQAKKEICPMYLEQKKS